MLEKRDVIKKMEMELDELVSKYNDMEDVKSRQQAAYEFIKVVGIFNRMLVSLLKDGENYFFPYMIHEYMVKR